MLTTKTGELIAAMEEIMDLVIRNSINLVALENVSETDPAVFQKYMRLVMQMKEYMVAEAGMLDGIDRKLDKLLELANK